VLAEFRRAQVARAAPGEDPTAYMVCGLQQLVGNDRVAGSCAKSTKPGWCYLESPSSSRCSREILFSPTGSPGTGATVTLECIEAQ
jgi:hypothetical protein